MLNRGRQGRHDAEGGDDDGNHDDGGGGGGGFSPACHPGWRDQVFHDPITPELSQLSHV